MKNLNEVKAGVVSLNVVSDDKFLEINRVKIERKEHKRVPVVTSWDITKIHGKEPKRVNEQFKRNRKRFEKEKDFFELTNFEYIKCFSINSESLGPNTKSIILFTASGYLKLVKTFVNNTEYKIIKKVYEFLGGDENIDIYVSNERFEISFLKMLEEALKEIDVEMIHQYYVSGYRIDFFLPKYNLAIEYDEEAHKFHNGEDKIREEKIEKETGCKFIRCSYKDSNVKNLMKILKEIVFLKEIENWQIWAYDKSRSSTKQVETFRYYENVVDKIYEIIMNDNELKNKCFQK